MTISYPLTLPDSGFTVSTFGADFNNVNSTSLNRSVQTISRPGDLLVLEFTLPRKTRAQIARWQAFGMALRGSYGSFYGYDPDARVPRGAAGGTPLVKGAGQSGYSLVTDGWPNSTAILKAGDWIEVNGLLRMVVADVSSDSSGNATLDISPGIGPGQAPADDAPITVANPKGKFRLVDNRITWEADALRLGVMSFTAIEDLRS